jgi:hypothetical protein
MTAMAKLKLLASRKAADAPLAAAPPAAACDEDDLPIPLDIKTVFLGGLFLLAMLAACYVGTEIVLPIVLAFVLSLVLQRRCGCLGGSICRAGLRPFSSSWCCLARSAGWDGAVGTGGELRAEAAYWASQIAGTPELFEPTGCGISEIRRSGPGVNTRRRT